MTAGSELGRTLTGLALDDEDSDSTYAGHVPFCLLRLSANPVLKFAAGRLCWRPARQRYHFASTFQRRLP